MDIVMFLTPLSEFGNESGLQILLTLASTSIPFAIKNAKVVGTLLLILPTLSFGVSVNTDGIGLNSDGITQIVGFILFLVAGILALFHKEDDNKKKRKAFAILLDFLDKVNSVKEWNDRLHELNRKLGPYQNILPDSIREAIFNIAEYSDIDELRTRISEELSYVSWKPASRMIKIVAVLIVSALLAGFGVYTFGNYNYPSFPAFPTLPILVPQLCSQGEHLENGVCVMNNPSPLPTKHPGGAKNIPTADAGGDQTVNEGEKVTLHGSGRDDSGADSLTYSWKKVKGISVSMDNNDNQDVTFVAPQVTEDESVIFQLTLSNGKNKDNDKTKVTIRNVDESLPTNDRPTVVASSTPGAATFDPNDTNCDDISSISLHADATDDGNIVSYKWEQTKGSAGQFISGTDLQDVSFKPPCKQQELSFSITVMDNNGKTDTDDIGIEVSALSTTKKSSPPADNPPMVEAYSEPQSVTYSYCTDIPSINLHADASDDGNIVFYQWEQIAGTKGDFSDQDLSDVYFEPLCNNQNDKIVFSVTVNDDSGATATDETSVVLNYQVP